MKKALIISGSERRHGITSCVSEITKKILTEYNIITEIVYLCELTFSPCDGCGDGTTSCNYRETHCEKNDDIPEVVKKMECSDIIVYITPVHAFGTSFLMQTFLERTGVGYLRFTRPLSDKVGGCIIIGRKYNLGNVHDQMINNMLLNRMIIPGSGFPVLIHGNENSKSTIETEEAVALEQMLSRLKEVSTSIKLSGRRKAWVNERELKKIREMDK